MRAASAGGAKRRAFTDAGAEGTAASAAEAQARKSLLDRLRSIFATAVRCWSAPAAHPVASPAASPMDAIRPGSARWPSVFASFVYICTSNCARETDTYAMRLFSSSPCACDESTWISTRSAVWPWLLWLVTA